MSARSTPSQASAQNSSAPYGNFRFEGFLDWVELSITLVAPTQVRHIRAALPCAWAHAGNMPFVEPAAGRSSTTDTVFIIRIQDPRNAAAIVRDLRCLDERFPLARPAEITGIEVGIDAWPKDNTADVVEMAEHFNRALACPASDNRRITGPKGTLGHVTSAMNHRRENLRALRTGKSIFIGNKTDPVTQRVYVKDGRRARYEVTLTGAACPVSMLNELARFKFGGLSRYFRFRAVDLDSLAPIAWTEWLPTLAKADQPAIRKRHGRLTKHGTRADRALHYAAEKALRRLSTQQGKGWKSVVTNEAVTFQSPDDVAEISTICDVQVLDLSGIEGAVLNTNFQQVVAAPASSTAPSVVTDLHQPAVIPPVIEASTKYQGNQPAVDLSSDQHSVKDSSSTDFTTAMSSSSGITAAGPWYPYADPAALQDHDAVFPVASNDVLIGPEPAPSSSNTTPRMSRTLPARQGCGALYHEVEGCTVASPPTRRSP